MNPVTHMFSEKLWIHHEYIKKVDLFSQIQVWLPFSFLFTKDPKFSPKSCFPSLKLRFFDKKLRFLQQKRDKSCIRDTQNLCFQSFLTSSWFKISVNRVPRDPQNLFQHAEIQKVTSFIFYFSFLFFCLDTNNSLEHASLFPPSLFSFSFTYNSLEPAILHFFTCDSYYFSLF